MKLKPNQTFEAILYMDSGLHVIKPNPPTPEAVAKAQFVDKTYQWKGSAANKAADVQPNI